MNWDDLRYVLALSRAGSLLKASKELGVDHTTVARRVESIEKALKVRLFTRTTTGYVATSEAEGLLPDIGQVEQAVHAVQRNAHAQDDSVRGTVRVTSGETFGICYLAQRLARLGREHPNLTLELITGGTILDLARRDADVAVRLFRSRHESLVVRRAGEMAHGLYASKQYLARRPLKSQDDLKNHPLLTASPGPSVVEATWLDGLTQGSRPAFVTNMTLALVEAAKAGTGIAVLPRYLGDAEPSLRHLPMPGEPTEAIWITVHKDLKQTPRVRVVLDFLNGCLDADKRLLLGESGG